LQQTNATPVRSLARRLMPRRRGLGPRLLAAVVRSNAILAFAAERQVVSRTESEMVDTTMALQVLALLALIDGDARSQVSQRAPKQARVEGVEAKQQPNERDLVIVKSTSDYEEARQAAAGAARRLKLPLNLRHLVPHRGGLTFPKTECEDIGCPYPCYLGRGVEGDVAFVSIEDSAAYSGVERDRYIVIIGSYPKGSVIAQRAARAARSIFKDVHIQTTGAYLGCIQP
jgi:hypothetical protein